MKNRILVLGAHPDDIEFAMGGTLSKLQRMGNKIFVAVFSPALQLEQNKHILEELHRSMAIMGISDQNYKLYDFRTRMFPIESPEIQNEVFILKQKFKPDVIYSPSENALHPDHSALGRCVSSVFQEQTIYHYEDIRGNHKQLISVWEELKEVDILRKINALKCYKSQFTRTYFDFNKIHHLISARGLQVGLKFVEGFEQVRTINRA